MAKKLFINLNQNIILTLSLLSILVFGMVGCVFENNDSSHDESLILKANLELQKSTINLEKYLDCILDINEEDLASYAFDFQTYEEGIDKSQYFSNTYNFFEDHKLLLEEIEINNSQALELFEEALQKDLDDIQKEYILMKISVLNKYTEVVSISKILIEKQEIFKKYIENSIRQSMTTCESCGGAPKSATQVGWKTAIPADWVESNIFLLKDQISKILTEAKIIDAEADDYLVVNVKSEI